MRLHDVSEEFLNILRLITGTLLFIYRTDQMLLSVVEEAQHVLYFPCKTDLYPLHKSYGYTVNLGRFFFKVTEESVHTCATSRLDFYNSLSSGCLTYSLKFLQLIQNATTLHSGL